MTSKKILFICLHRPDRTPSQRFRFEQYISILNKSGFECKHTYLLNAADDRKFYSKGKILAKAFILLKSVITLLRESSKTSYDTVFVQREAFMLGTAFFEKRFAKRARLVYDLDDSIWMHQTGEIKSNNRFLYFLKNPDKTKDIIQAADLIFAGNQYLADFAKQFNPNVVIVPTTIDTELYKPVGKSNSYPVCIGWSGSFSTIIHFTHVIPALLELKKKYKDKISFTVIGDKTFRSEELEIIGLPWTLESELEDLSKIDIGLMPLPDDNWTKGKCGLKGLQYMALSIPCIMSPVGVNSNIIQDGVNGFLADKMEEWVKKISLLIDNSELRHKMGDFGRTTVVNQYSVKKNQSKYVQYLG